MKELLYLDNIYIPTLGVNPSIVKSLLDITEPDKRKSTYTKTITLPRSNELDKILQHYFEVNLELGTFNPNNKVDAKYFVDSQLIINGYMRLQNVNITDINNITYEVTLSSDSANFFSEIKGHDLNEIDLSQYDHNFTKEIQQLSWDTSVQVNGILEPFAFGKGYVYPLIDYGYSTDLISYIFNQLGGAIYEHELMKAIIEFAGFTYTSPFLDSSYFKHLIVPYSPDVYTLDSDDIAEREFSANTPELDSTGTTTSNNLPDNTLSSHDTIIFTNELSDTGLNYDPTTGIFTCVNAGVYNIMALIDVNATFTPDTANNVKLIAEVDGYLTMRYTPNGGSEVQIQSKAFYLTKEDTSFYSGVRSTSATPTYPDTDYLNNKVWTSPLGAYTPRPVNPPDRYYLEYNGLQMLPGDEIRITYLAGFYSIFSNVKFIDAGATTYDGDATITIAVGAFYNKVSNTQIAEGNILRMDKAIPKVKMLDYFMSNVKRFNLIVDIDPNDEKNLLIYPRDDYYGSEVMNIQDIIDNSKPITQTPMSTMNVKRYELSYKPDKDYWNEHYTTKYQRVYGDRWVEVDSDMVNNIERTELIFSPTVMVAPAGSDRVIPTIKNYNEFNQPVTVKHNIRSLYYAGLKPCLNSWRHINYTATWPYLPLVDVFFEYPYAGHWDDAFDPTLDINFGLPFELFYDDNLNAITATDNNLGNAYHGKSLRENTDPRSRFVDAYVHLTPNNFNLFTFDKLYFFNRAYHRLHKIESYNPTSSGTTKCQFLLINAAGEFTPTLIGLDGNDSPFTPDQSGGGVTMTESKPVKGTKSSEQPDGNNYSSEKVYVSGANNYIASSSYNVEIYGSENRVFSDANNIKIHGSNNIIEAGVSNVVLINTSGLTIDESNVTYVNGIKSIESSNGSYSPTASNTTNLDSKPTMSNSYYTRVGNDVFVSGYFDADPTTTNTATSFEIDLPIPSTISNLEEVSGTAFTDTSQLDGIAIFGGIANNSALFSWTCRTTISSRWSYFFKYTIFE